MALKQKTTRTALSPVDILQALDYLGIEVAKEQGDEVWALCPMHETRVGKPDTKPSWSVNRETGLSNCFSCGYASNFVGLVMDVMKIDLRSAVKWVRKNGLTLDIADLIPGFREQTQVRKKPARLVPERVLQNFDQPPEKALQSRLVTAEACEHYGVLWDSHEGAWVLPIRWPGGVLMGYQWKKGSKVLNEPPRMRKAGCLFGFDVMEGRRMILVESPLDCVRLYSEGIKGAVSSFGAHVSDEQVCLITENAEAVVIALDDDAPGQKQTARLMRQLGRILSTYAFNYNKAEALPGKEGKDPGELTKASLYRGITTAVYSVEYADA